MSSRRKVGVSTATSEAARRQLMQPVPCWEKVWVPLANAPPGSNLKVLKWIKTDNRQAFSDDEEEVDEPLAPLPDDVEGNEGEEGDDQEEAPSASGAPDNTSRAVSESVPPPDETPQESEPKAAKPHPLSISVVPSPSPPPPEELDAALQPLATDAVLDVVAPELQVPAELSGELPALDVDLSNLGPDGTQFEAANDLTQIVEGDIMLSGELMDQSEDPFQVEPAP